MKISPPPTPKSPPMMPVRKPAIAKDMVAHGQSVPATSSTCLLVHNDKGGSARRGTLSRVRRGRCSRGRKRANCVRHHVRARSPRQHSTGGGVDTCPRRRAA